MLVHIPKVLTAEQLATCAGALEKAEWTDGRATAGYLSQSAKNNEQLPEDHPTAATLGDMILRALETNTLFTSAALPAKVVPPLFNRYAGDQAYGRHIDGAIRPVPNARHRVRTDLSATLFLCDPQSYDGGELIVEDAFGPREVKLAAGDMVLYPGTSVHRIAPVTRGIRLAAFFWIQSMVREDSQRAMLFELDKAVQSLAQAVPGHASLVDLAGVYHNLLRAWADV
jgi:PKHD-type hydroxylase